MALQPQRLNQLLGRIRNSPNEMPSVWSWGNIKVKDGDKKMREKKREHDQFQNLGIYAHWSFGRIPNHSKD
jgi:hypothetical protein